MRVLGLTLKILTSCGCWIPDSWTSPYKRVLYYAYTGFIFVLINTFTLSQFLDLVLIVDNADEFTDNFYILIAMMISCSKMFSLLINRNNIALLIEILRKKSCKPLELDELEIRQKFDKIIEYLIDFRFALLVNEKFRLIITLQFIVSTLVVCVILYQLTKTDANIIQLGLYMSCMLIQIFLYCWYGNEVRLKVCYLNLFCVCSVYLFCYR
ncbi:odorant receptor 4-like [Pogonomyrmex barbatus]|uniref:Odorant receptor 4-like n=1 Tax=Pogonomyrmex barbatus TaxID=144034 RepID=A0A6I9WDN4_9HYME|nr:odorant receptor 4-like [Pogonomyrmex barbatus]